MEAKYDHDFWHMTLPVALRYILRPMAISSRSAHHDQGEATQSDPSTQRNRKAGDMALMFALVMMLLSLVLPFAYARREPTLWLSMAQVAVWLGFCASWIYLGHLLDKEGNDIITTKSPDHEPRRFGSPRQILIFFLLFVPLAFAYIYIAYQNTHYLGFNFVLLFVVVGFATHFFPFWLVLIYLVAQVFAWGALSWTLWGRWPRADDLVTTASGYLFATMMFFFLRRERVSRHRAENLSRELDQANEKLRAFSGQIEELASTQERNRIAREIHDTLGHCLTVVNMQLETARALIASDAVRAEEFVGKAQSLTKKGLAEIRGSVASLRASPLDGVSLSAALQKLIETSLPPEIDATVSTRGQARELPSRVESALYRSAQEALTNVRKHAQAKRVALELRFEAPQGVTLIVRDDGIGCEKADGGFGILGIRERIHLLDGEMKVKTRPGEGLELSISLKA